MIESLSSFDPTKEYDCTSAPIVVCPTVDSEIDIAVGMVSELKLAGHSGLKKETDFQN